MRLIHTSDWHLGRTLHGESLLEHAAGFLDWLLTVAADRGADAVVVAGDVYGRADGLRRDPQLERASMALRLPRGTRISGACAS